MDMTAEAMAKTLEIANPEIHHDVEDSHGIITNYSTKPLFQISAKPFEIPAAVSVLTLAGLADLVKAKLEDADFPANWVIHIEDECTVALKPRVADEYGRRPSLIVAKPVPFDRFRFSQWHDQESFAIAIASLFADAGDKDYVLKLASTLTNEATTNTEDDGFTQRGTAKAGLQLKAPVTIKPRVDLAPYRTFPEIPQPVSPFVFRARCTGDGQPSLVLVEADGGRWKVDAIAELRRAMEAFGLGISIVA